MPYNCINKTYFLFFNGNETYLTDWLINNTLIPSVTKYKGQAMDAGFGGLELWSGCSSQCVQLP